MKGTTHSAGDRFRVWIARCEHCQPGGDGQVPPAAVAVEPAEQGTMSADEAATYVEAFNRAALGRSGRLWAVALPVTVRYEGEPRPGEVIEVHRVRFQARRALEKDLPCARQASMRNGLPPRESA
jgi:hypothetical protein